MPGFFDNLREAAQGVEQGVGGFFGGLARDVGSIPVPGAGVNVGQVAQQVPQAITQVSNAIGKVGPAITGQPGFEEQLQQAQQSGNKQQYVQTLASLGSGEGGLEDVSKTPTGGFFSNLIQSGIKKLTGDSETSAAEHIDGQKVQGTPEVIDQHTQAVMQNSKAPAAVSFSPNDQGPDTQYTFNKLKDQWGLLKNLSDQGVAASFDASGNVVAHDTDNAASSIISKIVKENHLDKPTVVKGDANIIEGENINAANEPAVQPNAESANGAVPNQAAKDSGSVQNPVLPAKPSDTSGPSEGQVLADRNKDQNKANASAYRDSVLSGAKEDARLTNPDALRQTIEYNKLPANASPNDTMPVYRAGKGQDIQPGDYVSVSKKMAEEYTKRTPGLEITKQSVPLSSLVKSDGLGSEFIYSPVSKEALSTGVRGTAETKAAAGLPVPKGNVVEPKPENVDPLQYQVSGKRAVLENAAKGETDVLKTKDRSVESKTFGERGEAAFSNASGMKAQALTQLEEARKAIPKAEQSLVTDALEGKDVQLSAKAQAWVDQAKSVLADFSQKAKAVGLRVYDSASNSFHDFQDVQNFFPHYATKDVQAALQGKNNEVIQKLIADKLATDPSSARAYLNGVLNKAEASRYGHLEIGRSDSNLPYIKDPKAVEQYVKDASDRIAWANQFGKDNEQAQQLIAGMKARGDNYGAQQATKFLQKYGNLREQDMVRQGASGLVSGVRTAETASKLEFVALKHLSQIPRAMAQNGVFRTLAQTPDAIGAFIKGENSPIVRQLSEVFHEDITGEDFVRTDSNKIGNAFLKAVGFKNTITAVRELAARGASAQLDSFIAKGGDTAERFLQKAGLDLNEIKAAGGPTLAQRQQYVEKALQNTSLYFKKGSMPAGWDTGPGKLVTMFKRFGYNDAVRGWSNWVDEAKHGNVTPLIVALAGTTAVGAGYVKATAAIRGKKPKQQGFFQQLAGAAAAGGVGGLPGEQILQAAQYPQYIGSQLLGLAGGPLASDVGQTVQNVGNLKGTATQQQQAVSSLLGNVPIAGAALQNRAAPAVTSALQGAGLTPTTSQYEQGYQKAVSAITANQQQQNAQRSANTHAAAARRASNAAASRGRRAASRQASAAGRRFRAAASRSARGAKIRSGGRKRGK